ncbi:sensor histidine kinase [Ornithinimicrobium murale]|uniref:sensor histidine kinase n=1 Tax=Ornithinimicrobium murale TaxID=1050153 RepID=UPI00192DC014|nr:sensor histidine kinase [Ornithinimicrobium murale]
MSTGALPRPGLLAILRSWVVAAAVATQWLVLGLGTALLALLTVVVLLLVAALCLIGLGLLLVGPALRLLRWVADLERRRLTAMGHATVSPYGPLPRGWGQVLRDVRSEVSTRRDLGWLLLHATVGLLLGLLPLEMLSNALQELSTPLWWQLAPGQATVLGGFVAVDTWGAARWGVVTGIVWALLWLLLTPQLARGQAAPGRRLLVPHPDQDLTALVARLGATRAAALDAHAVELRRIERALHDGTQNRLVAVTVLAGAARQALARDPASAEPLLERVQDGAELALAELRSVVRSILPPALEADGLPGALAALAAQCAVPTRVDVTVPTRLPVSIEAVAYYAVAEALTNVTRHSTARDAIVTVQQRGDHLWVEVADDGVGGATVGQGSGLTGIRDRVEAHDGTLEVHSPAGGPTLLRVVLPCG